MSHRLFSLGLLAAVASSLLSCKKDPAIAPTVAVPTICFPGTCYSGRVLGYDCWNGVLIQVDSRFPIGKPLPAQLSPDSLGDDNVIAAVNRLGSLATRGQRLYFTFENDPARQSPDSPCLHMSATIVLPIPHVVLRNVGPSACSTTSF